MGEKTAKAVFTQFCGIEPKEPTDDYIYCEHDVIVPGYGYIRAMRKTNVSAIDGSCDYMVRFVGRKTAETFRANAVFYVDLG